MKMSKTEENLGVRCNDGLYYCYARAPILCRDSKTGRDLHRDDKGGKYFLHTPGMTGRSSITPLSIEEARQIVERDGTAEQYAALFRGERVRKILLFIEGNDLTNLEKQTEAAGLSASEYLRSLIRAEARKEQKRVAERKRWVRIKQDNADADE